MYKTPTRILVINEVLFYPQYKNLFKWKYFTETKFGFNSFYDREISFTSSDKAKEYIDAYLANKYPTKRIIKYP